MGSNCKALLFFLFFSLLLASAFSVRAVNLSTEQQLDVLAARIAANENAVFNESNSSGEAITFEKQGFGPYHSIFRYVAIYAPRDKPWQEIFEVNTERSIGELDKSNYSNGLFVYLALPEVACRGCYTTRPAPEKFKALFYCPKTRDREYPNYLVYWEGSTYTPDYNAVIDALTRSCREMQDEVARLEAVAPSPSPSPSAAPSLSPSPSPSPSPSLSPSPSPSPAPSIDFNASLSESPTPQPATGLVAASAVGEDEEWLTYSALALAVGCAGIVAFYARKK